ncbi:endonuclease NucS [Geobacter sp. OR-1]|uniref:endonuclease NucS domain-containing protein n=1 Tax=Geobacter sp. OR-1 TaxID=1266765 RepID=UPI000542BB40|nr:endonuclease NucS domain-containing protein [Geobacter sp. OR-1]GAM11756.1 endonuclease NucS [Geobacter sp. OR-1]
MPPNTLPLLLAYTFGVSKGLEREISEIRSLVIEWDLSYDSSLRRGYIVELFEQNGIYQEFKALHWPHGNTSGGETFRRRFLNIKRRYEDFLAGNASESVDNNNEDLDEMDDQQFAAETDLRDFLAKNPERIEKGMTIYSSNGRAGVEFPVENGFIDILAVDKQGKFVVIELKVARGRNKTIGQILYYMGWVDRNLGNGPCRGMIIAKDISPDLILATERVPGVSLHRYKLSVTLEQVTVLA